MHGIIFILVYDRVMRSWSQTPNWNYKGMVNVKELRYIFLNIESSILRQLEPPLLVLLVECRVFGGEVVL